MSTKGKYLKAITKPTVVQKASDSAAAVIAKTDSPQALKDAATSLQNEISTYNTAFDTYNGTVAPSVVTAASVNDTLTMLKADYTRFKITAKGLHAVGIASAADLAVISFF